MSSKHLTIIEQADCSAVLCCDGQPILLLEPNKDPRDGEPTVWNLQGILVERMPADFTPRVSLSGPWRCSGAEYMRLGMQ